MAYTIVIVSDTVVLYEYNLYNNPSTWVLLLSLFTDEETKAQIG